MEFLQKLIDLIPMEGTAVMIVAGVLDFVLRLIPSEKPLGVLHAIAGVIKKLGVLFEKLAALSDKVLPQKKAEPKEGA